MGAANIALGGTPVLIYAEKKIMPPDTNPDPTIVGVVDFITSEARRYQERRDEETEYR
ncbi:MAG: hypothetical protein ACLFP4_08965 [Spirochaetales bacterium]